MAEISNGHDAEETAQHSSKPLTPHIKIEPASEWANNTFSALESSSADRVMASPTLNLPGSYPYSPSTLEPGPSFEEIKDAAKHYINAAGQFVPSHEDVRKIAHSASNTVRGYIPNGVSTRLNPVNPTQEAIPTSPIEEIETTPSSAGGFVLINRGNRTTKDEAQSGSEPQLTSVNKPVQIPSEMSAASRAKLLILEPTKHGKSDTNSVQTDLASEDASLQVLPGSKAESVSYHDIAPTPYSYTARTGITRSSSNFGTPASDGHADRRTLESLNISEGSNIQGTVITLSARNLNKRGERSVDVGSHGDYDVANGPSGEGSDTTPKADIAPVTGPGPGIAGKETNAEDGVHTMKEDEVSEAGLESILTNETAKAVGGSKSELKGAEKEIGSQKEEALNIREEGGSKNAGVKDDKQMKPQVEGVTMGGKLVEERPTEARKQPVEGEASGRAENHSPQLGPDKQVERVGSNTASDAHERDASAPKFIGSVPPSNTGKKPEDASANGGPRPQSPMTSENNPHVGRAVSGPNAKKLADPSTGSEAKSPEVSRSGRKKGSFVQRLKTWSKKLSHNRKEHS